MRLTEAKDISSLSAHDQACVRLARKARANTIHGGASALTIAKRCKYKKFPAMEIVSDVYGASNYSLGEWGAYECPECGSVHLGTENAWNCCSENQDDESEIHTFGDQNK